MIQETFQNTMRSIAKEARNAATFMRLAQTESKNAVLREAAKLLRQRLHSCLEANKADYQESKKKGYPSSLLDRLLLDEERIESIANTCENIATLPDPVGLVMDSWKRPNGMSIARVRTPLGVVGIIYESRPGVTAEASALCFKAGNPVILRGGKESIRSSMAIHACLAMALEQCGFPKGCVQIVESSDREAVGLMLAGLEGALDVVIPRGGKRLVERVQKEARVPVLGHLEGICHVYVHQKASLGMAEKIVVNAKMRRPGICGAAEKLLVDEQCAQTHLPALVVELQKAGCLVKGDEKTCAINRHVEQAQPQDWHTEYLDACMTVKVVKNIDNAIKHIHKYGSGHTDAIVTDDQKAAQKFLNDVDSAIVMHNVSTQFADGGEFGMGGEVGIATGHFHARGPVALEQLTCFKYHVEGRGQIRP